MRLIYLTLFCLIVCFSCELFAPYKGDEVTCGGDLPPQVIEYIPEKAGATITEKCIIQKADYVNYINNQFYIIRHDETCDTILLCTIQNGNVCYNDSFYIKKNNFNNNMTLCSINSVIDINNNNVKIFATVIENGVEFSTLLEVDRITGKTKMSECIKDFDISNKECLLYGDLSEDTIIAELHLSEQVFIQTLKYDGEYFSKDMKYTVSKQRWSYFTYLSYHHLFIVEHIITPSETVINKLYIYNNYDEMSVKTLDMTFLGLRSSPLSVIYDGNHYWIFVSGGNDKYELVKLKLL